VATTGPVSAAPAPAADPSLGSHPVTELAAAAPIRLEWAASVQEPMLIGEVGLATRSMLRNRSGRPSSLIRNPVPAVAAAAEMRRPARASDGRPVAAANAASTAAAPDSSPRNRYAGRCGSFQRVTFRTGRP
jgi:hypothetical protein